MEKYVIGKYKNKWAILQVNTRCWYFIGYGKTFCEKKCKELNIEA